MTVCAACGHELPEGAKFCLGCGAPVAPAAAPREQRKTVTVFFCDVAGSTELGESTDPEALCALLARRGAGPLRGQGHTANVVELRSELLASLEA
jgi:hypothetical protein